MTDPIESLHRRGRPAPTTEPATSAVAHLEQMQAAIGAIEAELIDAARATRLDCQVQRDAAIS
jgi:hypothetical protein